MAEHERSNRDKQAGLDEKHRTRQQESKPSFDKSHAWDDGLLSLTGTPFVPRMDAHGTMLSMIPFAEQRHDFIMQLQQTYGNRYVQRLMASMGAQANLTISEPGDIYEQEADIIAEAVSRSINTSVRRQPPEEEEEVQMQSVDSQPSIVSDDIETCINGNAHVQRVIDNLVSPKGSHAPDKNGSSISILKSNLLNPCVSEVRRSEVTSEETTVEPEILEFIQLCRDNGVSEEVIREVSNNPAARVQIRTAIESNREAWKEMFTEVLELINFRTTSKILGAVFSINAALDKAASGDYRGAAAEIVNLGVTGVLSSVAAVSMVANALSALFPGVYGYFQIFNASNTIDTLVRLVSGDFDVTPEEYIKLQSINDAIHNIPVLNLFSWTVDALFDFFADNQYATMEEVRQFLESESRLSSRIRQIFDEGIGTQLSELKSSLIEYYETRIAYTFRADTPAQAEGIILRLTEFASLLQNVVVPHIRSSGEVDNPERYALYIYEQISPYDPPYPVDLIREGISHINSMGSYKEEKPPEEVQSGWFSEE